MNKKNVAVAGAGPAGIMAAIAAARNGHAVTVYEKNSIPGRKLLITGKGRCNITNDSDISDIIDNIPGNGKFLHSALNSFGSREIIGFFESMGVKVITERGGRVFPASGDSAEITEALLKAARSSGVMFKFKSRIEDAIIINGTIKGIRFRNGGDIRCDDLIVATGGASYPSTGSTGDGYTIAKNTGHSLVSPKPSLVPLIAADAWVSELQGLSLRNVSAKFYDSEGIQIYEDFGEMLFTHYGVSGPIVLSGSAHLSRKGFKGATVYIDLKPALSYERLDERLIRDFKANSKKMFRNSLDELLPQKLIPIICRLSLIDPDKPVSQITRDDRLGLCRLIKGLRIRISDSTGFYDAIVTSGGVSISEINPRTMESRIVKGLYFAGEVIDVDGYSGGYNLTIAFATGYAAGSGCR